MKIQKKEIIVLKIDKTNRLAVINPENYMEISKEHTDNDNQTSWDECEKIQELLNGHITFLIKIF